MRSIIILLVAVLSFSTTVSAQVTGANQGVLFGNTQQPGFKLHTAIVNLIADGELVDAASASVLDRALGENATMLSPTARRAILANSDVSLEFVKQMVEYNNLFDTTKSTIESYPDNAREVVVLGVALYPDFAQEIIEAAALTGEIESNEALIAALSAGADPTTVSSATAAGPGAGAIANAGVTPIGAGIGAGGTGGGDTTTSVN